MLKLVYNRMRQREQEQRDNELIKRYTAEISQRVADFWKAQTVEKVTTISTDGTTHEYVKITAKVTGRPLSFFRLRSACMWDQPERQRRKGFQVKAETVRDPSG